MSPPTGIRFVMEGPNAARIRLKKRARLVTACDACRSKKIKCLQLTPDARCESCRISGLACSYQDRDRFHAERGMTTVHGSNSLLDPDLFGSESSPSSSSTSALKSVWPTNVDIESEQRLMRPFVFRSGSVSPTPPHSRASPLSASDPSSSSAADPLHHAVLFDPQRPYYPHPDLLPHLVDLFFNKLSCNFPFLDRIQVLDRISSNSLPAVLANSIAALASRFSDRLEKFSSADIVGEPFIQLSKLLTIQMMAVPSIDLLHSLILIAWAEHGAARDREYFMYSRMAVAMLVDLGLDKVQTIQFAKDEIERDMLRLTWWSVAYIDLTSSWACEKSTGMRDAAFDVALPSTQTSHLSLPPRTLIYAYLAEMLNLRKDLLNAINADLSSPSTGTPAQIIGEIRHKLLMFYRMQPDSMTFSEENFRRFDQHNQGPLLMLLHLGFHGLCAFVNWPSLFKDFVEPIPHSISAAFDSAKAVAETLSIVNSVNPNALHGNLFMNFCTSIAVRVLVGARNSMDMALAKNPAFSETACDNAIHACLSALASVGRHWRSATALEAQLLEIVPLSVSHKLAPLVGASDDDYHSQVASPNYLSSASESSLPSPAPAPSDLPPRHGGEKNMSSQPYPSSVPTVSEADLSIFSDLLSQRAITEDQQNLDNFLSQLPHPTSLDFRSGFSPHPSPMDFWLTPTHV